MISWIVKSSRFFSVLSLMTALKIKGVNVDIDVASTPLGSKIVKCWFVTRCTLFYIVVLSVLDLVGSYLKKSKNVMSALFTANSSANRMYRCTMVFGPLPDVLERCSIYQNDCQRLNFSAREVQTLSTTHDHRRTGQWSRRFIRVVPANMHINRYLFDCL